MQHYCFYQEISLVIQEFYAGDKAFNIAPFYEYWDFKVSDQEQEEIIALRKARQAEQILSEIDMTLNQMKQRVDYLQVAEEIELAVNSIFFRFEQLKEYAQNHSAKKLELRLAAQIYEAALNEKRNDLRIKGFRFIETHLKFVSYFFLLDKISTRTTVYLFLYALFSAHRFDADILSGITETAVEDGILDTVKGSDKVKEITNDISSWIAAAFATTWGAPLATFLISFSVKALWLLIKESQQEELTENEQPGVDYANFKQNIAEQLVHLKNSGVTIPEFEQMMK
ncbi:hypothetical protein [Spirosoma panaciterrae]|uniref:hypothetical protein n=1 Tax=Spirosoma panaciterrae TaxID=496058 RepID=UPI0012FC9B44|nr:hypothetical protein [Spirosoma panaciterrae]